MESVIRQQKTKREVNEKEAFFERLYWVVFQFFKQKYFTLYYTISYKIILFDAALLVQNNMMRAGYAEWGIK